MCGRGDVHCPSCKGWSETNILNQDPRLVIPDPRCPGCGHEDLEAQLAEANRKVDLYERTVWPSEENRQARKALEATLAEAQRELALLQSASNAQTLRLIKERDSLKATLEQAREILAEVRAQWGDDYLWEKWHLDERIAALDAGKE